MSAIPAVQRAIVQPDKMSTEVVMTSDHPVPQLDKAAGEHLIQVKTVAITRGELLWPRYFPTDVAVPKVLVPCDDVAGVVVDGPEASPFRPGARVYARSNYRRAGGARQYTVLLAEEMAPCPSRLSWPDAAAVPMSAETAWQALFVHAGLTPQEGAAKGTTILITAASGGVGVWLVQLAKWIGATAIATCGPGSVERVKALGADEVLDHTKDSVEEWLKGRDVSADLVVDCIGGQALADAWHAVKRGGKIFSVVQPPASVRPAALAELEVSDLFFVMEPDGKQLEQIGRLIEDFGMESSVDSVFAFDEFQAAFARAGSGKATGKVVMEVS